MDVLFSDILENFETDFTAPKPMLHCTANYLARSAKNHYHTAPNVLQSMGRKFTIVISGFVYSELAISARVDLYAESRDKGGHSNGTATNVEAELSQNSIDQKLNLFEKVEEESLRERFGAFSRGDDDSVKIMRHGCSAHVTIAYCQNGQARQSGQDILKICEQQYSGNFKQLKVASGTYTSYKNNIYEVSLNKPIEFECLFHGFYTGYR